MILEDLMKAPCLVCSHANMWHWGPTIRGEQGCMTCMDNHEFLRDNLDYIEYEAKRRGLV